jgi:WhiB family redox-sensing transcriptional regulator
MQAKAYCADCPVLARCREHALVVHEPYGVWGGLTPRERDRLIEESNSALPRQRSVHH